MTKKPDELTAADVPNATPEQFAEWKELNRRARRVQWTGLAVWATTFITVPVIGGAIGWALPIVLWFAFMFGYAAPLAKRERALAAQLGIPAALGLPADYSERMKRRVGIAKRVAFGFAALIALWAVAVVIGIRRDDARTAERNRVAQASAAALARPYAVTIEGATKQYMAAAVHPSFFDVARVTPILGLGFDSAYVAPSSPRVAVISYDLWQELYHGDLGALMRDIRVDGNSYLINGVAPKGFTVPGNTALWIPEASAR
jgi:hypothetical protein